MKRKNQWTAKDWNVVPFELLSRAKRRERMFREVNYACPECGFNQRREDGRHVLEIDHIDGNHKNESRENLRVLCPNCHAMTPNFRNFGRSTKKSSTRFRRENRGYDEARQLIKQREASYIEEFKRTVIQTHESGEIDFKKHGWVQRLSEKLNDQCPQAVSRRLRRLLPEFYVNNCKFRSKKM